MYLSVVDGNVEGNFEGKLVKPNFENLSKSSPPLSHSVGFKDHRKSGRRENTHLRAVFPKGANTQRNVF